MATKTFEELKQLAIQIRDEKANKQNTATRIGTQMIEHLNKLEEEYYNKENIDEQKAETDNKFSELDQKCSSIALIDYDKGSQYLKNFASKREARESIDVALRKKGLRIKYLLNNVLNDETFGDYSLDKLGEGWFIESNWTDNTRLAYANAYIRLQDYDKPYANLKSFQSKKEARDSAPRILGIGITYILNNSVIREFYIGNNNGETYWSDDNNWIDEVDMQAGYTSCYSITEANNPNLIKNFTTKNDARSEVKSAYRKKGLRILYSLNGSIQEETFGNYSLSEWLNNDSWTDNTREFSINGVIRLTSKDSSPQTLAVFSTRQEARDAVETKYKMQGCTISYFQGSTSDKRFVKETFCGTNTQNWLDDSLWKETDTLFAGYVSNNNINNYIKQIFTSSGNIISIACATYRTKDNNNMLSLFIAEFDLSGTFIKYVAKLVNCDVNGLPKGNNVLVTLDNYNPDDPVVKIVLDVDRILLSKDFTVGSTPATPQLTNTVYSTPIDSELTDTNSLKLNYGSYYPFVNVPETWRKNAYAKKAFELFKAILDIKVTGADPKDEYVYSIIYLFKERTANDWGNGIKIGKIKRDDPTIVAFVQYKSPTASSDVAAELNKISLNKPVWMYINAFGCTFEILIDGSKLSADTDGFGEYAEASSNPFWGYYISESTYIKKETGGISSYKTVTEAAIDGAEGVINVGQSIIVGQKKVSVGSYEKFTPSVVYNNYINCNGSKSFKKVKKSELKRVQVDGITMYISSFSKDYIYYTPVKRQGTQNPMDIDSYQYPFLAFAKKNSPDDVIKINLPEQLPESKFLGKPGRRHNIIELPDGNHLIDVENGEAGDENLRKHQLYKVYGILDKEVIGNEITIGDEDIKFLFRLAKKDTRLIPAWGVRNYGKNTIISPYGSNRVGMVYLSKDSFETWKCIFNMGVEDVYVEPKGDTGYWPTEESVIPSGSLIWANTGNGNAHVHGCAYDPWYDRYWVVSGDGGSYDKSVTGIWYTDDEGRNWHRVEIRKDLPPFAKYGTQMITIIPMEQCVLFASDGTGDGFYRWNRSGKDAEVNVELVYSYTGKSTELEVLGGGHCVTESGFVLQLFNPDSESQGDFAKYKGGVVSTYNGYFFEKIYEDEYSEGTYDTAEINWMGVISENSNGDIIIKAEHGGYIRLIVE